MSSSGDQERSEMDSQTQPSASKGKNKEDSSTTTERIANSGRAMLGSLIAPDHQSLSSSTLGGKASGSAGVRGPADPVSSHTLEASTSRSSGLTSGQSLANGSFRSARQLDAGMTTEFGQFVSESQPNLKQFEPRTTRPGHEGTISRSIAAQEAVDGSAVFDLLSRPDEESDWMPETHEEDYVSPSEAARLRAALFNSDSSHHLSWDRLLNFSPNFVQSSSETPSQMAAGQMGITDVREAENLWLQQWLEVLSSYTDEVWGDLGQLVREVRKETAGQASGQFNGDGPIESKALARLRQILAHVRGDIAHS